MSRRFCLGLTVVVWGAASVAAGAEHLQKSGTADGKRMVLTAPVPYENAVVTDTASDGSNARFVAYRSMQDAITQAKQEIVRVLTLEASELSPLALADLLSQARGELPAYSAPVQKQAEYVWVTQYVWRRRCFGRRVCVRECVPQKVEPKESVKAYAIADPRAVLGEVESTLRAIQTLDSKDPAYQTKIANLKLQLLDAYSALSRAN